MLVAVVQVLTASKSEPLAAALTRIYSAFHTAGLGEPLLQFTLVDAAPLSGLVNRVSAVARAVRRYPELEPFAGHAAPIVGRTGPIRSLSNLDAYGGVAPVPFLLIEQIASGIPRALPFAAAHIRLSTPSFSVDPERLIPENRVRMSLSKLGVAPDLIHAVAPGVTIQDTSRGGGRQRMIFAMTTTVADDADKRLPPPPAPVAALVAACGKPRRTLQQPISPHEPTYVWGRPHPLPPDRLLAIQNDYRCRIKVMAEAMPHEILPLTGPGEALLAGPQKPELQRCFTPLGYSCRGDNGTFALRRRTAANLTVELSIDVGTWSHSLTASYAILGISQQQEFRLQVGLPPSAQSKYLGERFGWDHYVQVQIGGPDRWRQLVENLASIVAALDASFARDAEAAAGPSPPWYQPDRS